MREEHRRRVLGQGSGRREAASHPCAGSLEKRSPWAVPILLGITQSVPIAVVVALTGEHFGFVSEHFGFVMLAFLVSAFAVARTEETSFAGAASFATGEDRCAVSSAVTVRPITGGRRWGRPCFNVEMLEKPVSTTTTAVSIVIIQKK